VREYADGGTDRVISALFSYTLGAQVENLDLANGTGAAIGTGNTLANFMSGNEAGNVLDGGAGNDTLAGYL
jgi:hypothetical protein